MAGGVRWTVWSEECVVLVYGWLDLSDFGVQPHKIYPIFLSDYKIPSHRFFCGMIKDMGCKETRTSRQDHVTCLYTNLYSSISLQTTWAIPSPGANRDALWCWAGGTAVLRWHTSNSLLLESLTYLIFLLIPTSTPSFSSSLISLHICR